MKIVSASALLALGCTAAARPASLTRLRARSSAPTPTAPQLKWQQTEIMALVHFNMATFYRDGDPGCTAENWVGPTGSGNPASFAPTALNTSQWVDSMVHLGASHAVLTAKHGCGFLLWPSNVTLGSGQPYTYKVSPDMNVFQQFVDAATARGLGTGAYYSYHSNYYENVLSGQVQNTTLLPGQVNVTQAEFEHTALQHLTQLWTDFGPLTEIWLDGGYPADQQPQLQALLGRLQPNAVVWNGYNVSANPISWAGSEWGVPPGYPNDTYSTVTPDVAINGGAGVPPNTPGAVWAPGGVDFTLQQDDTWFFEPNHPLHNLSDLIGVYHCSVGANGVLELDFAIDRTGQVHPAHAAMYQTFGDWIRSCYGTPLVSGRLDGGSGARQLVLSAADVNTAGNILELAQSSNAHIAAGDSFTFDRVMLREDLSLGQRVLEYSVEYLPAASANGASLLGSKSSSSAAAPAAAGDAALATDSEPAWVQFSSGQSVGNKKIDVGSANVTASAVRVTVLDAIDVPHLTFSVFTACPSG
jgi:alpha-L-fucosidase